MNDLLRLSLYELRKAKCIRRRESVSGVVENAPALARDGRLLEHLKDQYRHAKTILIVGAAASLLEQCGIPQGKADAGLLVVERFARDTPSAFIGLLGRHRHFERETDPPRI